MNKFTTKIKPGEEYITVAGEDVLLVSMQGQREYCSGAQWFTPSGGSGAFRYRVKVKPLSLAIRRDLLHAEQDAMSARLRAEEIARVGAASYTSLDITYWK